MDRKSILTSLYRTNAPPRGGALFSFLQTIYICCKIYISKKIQGGRIFVKKNVIEGPNKTRLLNGLLAVLLAITLIAPAVFQSTTPAASKRTPARPAITKVTATKNSATVTWNFQLFYITSFIFPTSSFSACLSTD